MRALVITKDEPTTSFVRIGNADWPGGYAPYIVTGTGPQLAALTGILVAQAIRYVDNDVITEQLAENFTLNQFNSWLSSKGYAPVSAVDPVGEATAQDMTVDEAVGWWLLAAGYSQSEADALCDSINALVGPPVTLAAAIEAKLTAEAFEPGEIAILLSALNPILAQPAQVENALTWWLRGAAVDMPEIDAIIASIRTAIQPVTREDAFRTVMAGEGYNETVLDNAVPTIWQRAIPIKTKMNDYLEANGYELLPDVGDGYTPSWRDATAKKIAPGALTTINTWLVANGHEAMTADNSVLDLVHVFEPGYSLGADNVFDAAA